MFVCLCKALTEAEVVRRTRCCIEDGVRSSEDIVEALGLVCEDSCGFCVENPQHIIAIFDDELEAHLGYTAPSQESVPNA